jgi:serine/threonine protein kinase/Tfp pilus assembly protein PilF
MRETIGRYHLLRPLGRGAMGTVYLAQDATLNRDVAIKMVDFSIEESSQRSFFLDRLLRDAKAAAMLSHPNIVGIYDVIEEEAAVYLVMEYVPGESLASYLDRNPTPDVQHALSLLRQMASALDYTHGKGVIHRDVKPGNVMREPNGVVKILDFGIARLSDGVTSTPAGVVMGTLEYMSPEQLKGDTLDGRSDQFSLAAVAYRILTGSTLFGSHTVATLTYKLVNEMPPPPTQRNTSLPPAVDRVLMRALGKSPVERYKTCSEFVDVLAQAFVVQPETVVAQLPTTGASTAPQPSPIRSGVVPPNRKSRLIAWIVVAACLGVAALLVVWRPWNRQADAIKNSGSSAVTAGQTAPAVATTAPSVEKGLLQKQASKADASANSLHIAAQDTTKSQNRKPVGPANVDQGQKKDTVELDRRYRDGKRQLNDKDFAGAIQSFTAVIAIDPEFRRVYHERGYAYQLAQQPESAIKDYSLAVQIDPQDAMSYSDRAVCLAHLHQDDKALVDFNRALEIKPDLAAALNGRGAIFLRRRNYAQAMRSFDSAIGSNPKFAPAYQNRAKAKRALGDTAGAEADLRKASELKASDTEP